MRFFTLNKQPFAEVTTRAPVKMHIYSKAVALSQGVLLRKLHSNMVELFLKEKPWKHGLKWRPVQSRTQTMKDATEIKDMTKWMQVNMRLPQKEAQDVERVANEEGIDMVVALYTMLYWYTWFIRPPLAEQKRRDELKKQRALIGQIEQKI